MSIDLDDVPVGLRPAVTATLAEVGVEGDCHLGVALVSPERMQELNREFRDRDTPTDVLSIPIDDSPDTPGPRELGDVFICESECHSVPEAVVHGVLHLCGFDHELDQGEMFELQDRITAGLEVG